MANNEITKKIPMELLCLLLLQERDMYGYEMVTELEKRSDGLLSINMATMYVSLKRLTDNGYVSIYRADLEDVRARMRIYYHLEPGAAAYREKIYEEYMRTAQGVENFLNFKAGRGTDGEAEI